MDKNVGSVNLDELRAARESLDMERGIETDPNLYNDYDPEKHKAEKEQERLARQRALDEATGDVSDEVSQPFDAENNNIVEESSNDIQSVEGSNEKAGSSIEPEISLPEESVAEDAKEEILTEPENVEPQDNVQEEDTSGGAADNTSMLDIFKEFEVNDSFEDDQSQDSATNSEVVSELEIQPSFEELSTIETIEINEVEEPLVENIEIQNELPKVENDTVDDFARSPEIESKAEDTETNSSFDVYDNFADFEINSAEQVSSVNIQNEVTTEHESETETEVESDDTTEVSTDETTSVGGDNSLDEFLSELDSILAREDEDEEDLEILDIDGDDDSTETDEIKIDDDNDTDSIENVDSNVQEEKEESLEEMLGITESHDDESQEIETDIEVEEETTEVETDNVVEENVEKVDLIEEVVEPVVSVEPRILDDDFGSNLERFSVNTDDIKVNEDIDFDSQTEVLSDFSKLSSIAEEIEQEEQQLAEAEQEEIVETTEIENNESVEEVNEESAETEDIDVGGYQKIEEFNFIDVISSDEFKEEDNLSYVLGKDGEGNILYCNLRDTCGTAIFTKNEDVVFSGFSSILLSLLLKNTPQDIQFVICDAMFDSEFDVFKNSSYMYFNRVAKNNREIVDSLLELSKELENRYNNLVYSGVKSISAYNMQAEERGSQKMPYVVLFMNNYAKMTQFLDADRINNCLYNILKFGRLVGVYAIIASTSDIERDDINYNLPTRISYKTEDEHDSIAAIGREGAEKLKDEKDFLYSTVYDEEIKHLKVPNLTRKEIELIIENLEI